MRAKEFINEIDYTPGTEDIAVDDATIIKNSIIIGDIDNRDVHLFEHEGQQCYFFKKDGIITALVITSGNHLRGIKNIEKTPGLVTAIIGFITHRLRIRLQITPDEPLSPEGFRWIKSLLLSGDRGLNIKDQTGKYPDIGQLEQEWTKSMTSDQHVLSSITIESKTTRHLKTKSEMGLMPNTYFVHYKDTI